jgi:hypothetical protein
VRTILSNPVSVKNEQARIPLMDYYLNTIMDGSARGSSHDEPRLQTYLMLDILILIDRLSAA